jgi:hypothetical protein
MEQNNFFKGVVNGLILCLPFWVFMAYVIWR